MESNTPKTNVLLSSLFGTWYLFLSQLPPHAFEVAPTAPGILSFYSILCPDYLDKTEHSDEKGRGVLNIESMSRNILILLAGFESQAQSSTKHWQSGMT